MLRPGGELRAELLRQYDSSPTLFWTFSELCPSHEGSGSRNLLAPWLLVGLQRKGCS